MSSGGDTGGSADTVKAALVTGVRRIEFVDLPRAVVESGMVEVGIRLCGICGTDLSSYQTGSLHSPAVCGHEWVGDVTQVGSGVTEVVPGDRVVIAVRPPCGQCAECLAGLTERCAAVLAMARGRDALAPRHGGFASSIVVEATRVLRVPASLTDEEAALIEPTAVAVHGIRRAETAPGDIVVIQGGGPIGLLAMQCARVADAAHVCVIEPAAMRRRIAQELGADSVIDPTSDASGVHEHLSELTNGVGPDVVIECAGLPALLQGAVDLVRPGGTVLLLSYIGAQTTIHPATWLSKEVTVKGAVAYTHDDFHQAMNLVSEGSIDLTRLHTGTIPLVDIADGFTRLSADSSSHIKVLVDPR